MITINKIDNELLNPVFKEKILKEFNELTFITCKVVDNKLTINSTTDSPDIVFTLGYLYGIALANHQVLTILK